MVWKADWKGRDWRWGVPLGDWTSTQERDGEAWSLQLAVGLWGEWLLSPNTPAVYPPLWRPWVTSISWSSALPGKIWFRSYLCPHIVSLEASPKIYGPPCSHLQSAKHARCSPKSLSVLSPISCGSGPIFSLLRDFHGFLYPSQTGSVKSAPDWINTFSVE